MIRLLCSSIFIGTLILSIVTAIDQTKNIVQIINSGSSNTAAYVIALEKDGTVNLTVTPRLHPIILSTKSTPTHSSIPIDLVNDVFDNIQRALPFDQYTNNFCIKSVSFGTVLRIHYQNQQSPDLNCPLEDVRLISLNKAIREVISLLHINTLG